MTGQGRIALIAVLHSLVILVMIGLYVWTSVTGEEITIQTRYVQPNELVATDNPQLDLQIGRIALEEIRGEDDFNRWSTVYVALKPGQDAWYADSIHASHPGQFEGVKILRGRITRIEAGRRPAGSPREPLPIVTVQFGVEDLHLSKEAEEWMDTISSKRQMTVRLLVDDSGRALRRGVDMLGRTVVEDTLF